MVKSPCNAIVLGFMPVRYPEIRKTSERIALNSCETMEIDLRRTVRLIADSAVAAFFAAFSLVCLPVSDARSVDDGAAEYPVPTVCVGHDAEYRGWVPLDGVGANSHCAVGSAVFSHALPTGAVKDGPNLPEYHFLSGNCCPLPKGMLTDHEIIAENDCPGDFLVTGIVGETRMHEGEEFSARRLVCAQIDTSRYVLGDPVRVLLTGFRRPVRHYLKDFVARSRIPASLRYALGRRSQFQWDPFICVPYPFDSVLTGRPGLRRNYCDGIIFRQILHRSSRTPVKLFADCEALDNPFSPTARCAD